MKEDGSGLDRFLAAQGDGEFESALSEIQTGQKRSHWIWYVFPQLRGIGTSPMSQRYGIEGRNEAAAYLRHPVLSVRLRQIAEAAADQARRGVPLTTLMGSAVDAAKLVSSMTLFGTVAHSLPEGQRTAATDAIAGAADAVLAGAASQGIPRCRQTEATLAS